MTQSEPGSGPVTPRGARPPSQSLDKDLDRQSLFERAASHVTRKLLIPGVIATMGLLAILMAGPNGLSNGPLWMIAAAALAAFYMAINIGANDVTNNTGAAVGARALSMAEALAMAALFEILGAVMAGSNVTRTISSGIVSDTIFPNETAYALAMMAALAAAAIWINIATWLNAPISTTHSIVGAVAGAAAMAVGPASLDIGTLFAIVIGWMASPVIAGATAALIIAVIDASILRKEDKIAASLRVIPLLSAAMAGTFGSFLMIVVYPNRRLSAVLIGLLAAAVVFLIARFRVSRQVVGLENKASALKVLFRVPLVVASAILCFAHGANDVSNAAGPLVAIILAFGQVPSHSVHPPDFWPILIGAIGISTGVVFFGPRLIRLVGEQITKLNPARAFSVSLATATTVNLASFVGLPVSTTHVAVGAVFGVGFFREWSRNRAPLIPGEAERYDAERINREELTRRKLVRRSHFMTIIGAWLITVPLAGSLAAAIFWLMVRLFP